MHSRCHGHILLGAFILCVALAVMDAHINVKKPFGPKMCERLCKRIVGCLSYIYRTSRLSCDLTHDRNLKQNPEIGIYVINITKDKEKMLAENALNCNQGGRIVYTRGRTFTCSAKLSKLPILRRNEDRLEIRMTRLLMFGRIFDSKGQRPGRQLYLGNNSAVAYPFIQAKFVSAIAYIPSHRTLVVAAFIHKLYLAPIDENNKVIIKIKGNINAIAIDHTNQLVYMARMVTYLEHFLSVMKANGKNLTSLLQLPHSCTTEAIEVDHQRSLIYVLCHTGKILQVSYQGDHKGYIVGIGTVGRYMLHKQGHILYYQTLNGNIQTLSLWNQSVTKVTTMKMPPISKMLTVGDILYIFPFPFRGDLLLANRSGIGNITRVHVGFTKKVDRVAMCLIP